MRITALAALLLALPPATAQVVFTHALGTATGQTGAGVAPVADGYLIAAGSFDGATTTHRARLVHCGTDGLPVSETALPITGRVFVQGMASGAGGLHFLCGSSFAPGALHHDGLLVRLGDDGSAHWTARPDVPGDQQYLGAAATDDGGAVVCGVAPVNGTARPLACRFGPDGGLLWQQVLMDEAGGIARDVAVDPTGMVITGRRVNPSGHTDTWMARLDLDGNTVWTTAVGGPAHEEGHAVVRSADGHFISAGFTDSYGPVYNDSLRRRCVHLIKVDAATGDTLWTRTTGDTLRDRTALAIDMMPNGDLIVAGVRAQAPGSSQALAQRFTPQGSITWERQYQAGKEDRLWHVRALPVGFIATGASFGMEGHKALLIRRDNLGE
ncbi:MAG: hypothetical protein RBT71_06620 [Flavobacteriales bacterium]|jgi:hypothetical protein|nr:hypothetical protein [Flavobacteriales bacterium]